MNRIAGERFECPPPLLPERVGFDPDEMKDASQCSALPEKLTVDRDSLVPVNLLSERALAERAAAQASGPDAREAREHAIHWRRRSDWSRCREWRARRMAARGHGVAADERKTHYVP